MEPIQRFSAHGQAAAKAPANRLVLLTLSHLWIDFYATLYSPLAETFASAFKVTMAQISWLPVVVSIFGSMSQPLYGLLGDRFNRIVTAAVSVLVAAAFTCLIGFAPNLWILGLLLVLGSLGVSAFHPNSAAAVTEGHPRPNFAMSIFMVGGSAGLAAAPAVVSVVASRYGLPALWLLIVPGVLMAFVLLLFIGSDHHRAPSRKPAHPKRIPAAGLRGSILRSLFARGTGPIWLLLGIACSRSFASMVFQTFISFLGRERGWNVEQIGQALSIFLFSGAAGSLAGGFIADRLNAKAQIAGSCLLAIPFLVGFVRMDGTGALVSFGLAGFLIWIAQPINVALAQNYRPRSSGAVSGLMLGLAWGLAGLLMRPFGGLADRIGIDAALTYAPFALIPAVVWALLLPRDNSRTG